MYAEDMVVGVYIRRFSEGYVKLRQQTTIYSSTKKE
jgi:hypothetical protein